jgi:cell division septum initiation protein DivIVA
MPKKKSASKRQPAIRVGNISNIPGNVNIAGGNITTHQTITGLSGTEIKQLFDKLYTVIETNAGTSPAEKEDLKAEVKEIQTTVTEAAQKNEKIDEGFLSRRFRNIARVAPDILDVVVATLGSPLAGLGVAVKKIADKAKEETKAS